MGGACGGILKKIEGGGGVASTVVESRSGFRYEYAARFGKSENTPCSPWLCESKNALGEMASAERCPRKWGLTDYAIGVCF